MGAGTVSVVVPVYKVKPEYLRQCVESILGQTYKDLEVILVDDGSPDSCGAICDEYARADERVSVIHQQNAGAAAARNVGMDFATGEYLAFVDSDDWLDNNYFNELIAAFRNDAQIISCCCKVILENSVEEDHFFDGDRLFSDELKDGEGFVLCAKEELFCQLLRSAYGQPQRAYTAIGVPWGKLYRAALIRENGFRFQLGQKMREDNVLNMYVFNTASEIMYLDRPLYNYRYEHIVGWARALGDEYEDVCLVAAKARLKAMRETGLCNNPRLQSFCDAEIGQCLIGTLNNVVFRPGAGGTLAQKRKRAKRLAEGYPYGEVVKRHPRLVGIKSRFWVFLARHRMWRTYGVLRGARNVKHLVCR